MKKYLGLMFILFTLCSCESLRNVRKESRFIRCKDSNCSNCAGIGYTTCTICKGTGQKLCLKCGGTGAYACRDCGGSGIADCFNSLCREGYVTTVKTVRAPTKSNPYAVKVINRDVICRSCHGRGTRFCRPMIECPPYVSCPTTVACPKGYTLVWWQCRNCGQKHDYKPKRCSKCGEW